MKLLLRRRVLPIRQVKVQLNRECGTLVRPALYRNRSPHQRHQIPGNRHPKTGSAAGPPAVLLFKGIEYMAQKRLAHAHAGVADSKAQPHPSGPAPQLADLQPDGTAPRRKFDGVGQQIDQYLIQPQLIAGENGIA